MITLPGWLAVLPIGKQKGDMGALCSMAFTGYFFDLTDD